VQWVGKGKKNEAQFSCKVARKKINQAGSSNARVERAYNRLEKKLEWDLMVLTLNNDRETPYRDLRLKATSYQERAGWGEEFWIRTLAIQML